VVDKDIPCLDRGGAVIAGQLGQRGEARPEHSALWLTPWPLELLCRALSVINNKQAAALGLVGAV
jgi:hypothetical protein